MSDMTQLPNAGDGLGYRHASTNVAESSRALVLCTSAKLEHELGEILREFLLDAPETSSLLQGPGAPLALLSARIQACYALALIDKHEFADCEIISRVHDEFHRSPYASFSDSIVIGLCKKLHFRALYRGPSTCGAQERFRTAAAGLAERLANRAFYIGGERRTRRNWTL